MSAADLLRRAATKLRQSVSSPAFAYMPAPWWPVLTDSESFTGVAACPGQAEDEHMPGNACDDCTSIETWAEPVAAYIALMHPPVALALAGLLDGSVAAITYALAMGGTADTRSVEALARAVLREPEEEPRG